MLNRMHAVYVYLFILAVSLITFRFQSFHWFTERKWQVPISMTT